jgi:hypothetical protein
MYPQNENMLVQSGDLGRDEGAGGDDRVDTSDKLRKWWY